MKIFSVIRRILLIALLVAALIGLNMLKANPVTAESWTRSYVRMYGQYAAMISGYVPISLTEILAIVVIIAIIVLVIAFIVDLFKGKPIKAVNRILSGASLVLFIAVLYSFSCELAYNRDEIPLPFYETEVNKSEFVNIYNYYADDLNDCIASLTFDENGEIAGEVDFAALTNEVKQAHAFAYDEYYHPYLGSVKTMYSSIILRELHITGVTFAPFGEANINDLNTKIDLPYTIAHELAHTRGVMREDDANQLAFYVCLNSDSPYLRYSAYCATFYQLEVMVSTTYLTDVEREGLHEVNAAFDLSRNYVNAYWEKYKTLKDIGEYFNNLYIKSSGIEEGIDSYAGGTEIGTDPETNELIPSLYQKLYFEKYFRA
ncbi:MAG TPA: DUF3810 domain-containing protein [Erysipelotrichaceae bacterium]|nr:DUF3810 domain-containing protein [Erysipelotrichaceae bacterium]